MAERQWFGFKYQKEFCQKNNLIENKNYTDKFDTKIKNLSCQIKTYKNNCELMMAEPFRYLKNKEDFILVVANRNDKDEIISERKILIKNNKLQSFFKEQDFEFRVNYCKSLLDSVSNDTSDDKYFKEHMKAEQEARNTLLLTFKQKEIIRNKKEFNGLFQIDILIILSVYLTKLKYEKKNKFRTVFYNRRKCKILFV